MAFGGRILHWNTLIVLTCESFQTKKARLRQPVTTLAAELTNFSEAVCSGAYRAVLEKTA